MKNESYEYFLEEVMERLLSDIDDVLEELKDASSDKEDFLKGQLEGYYEFLSLMKSEASKFGITLPKKFEDILSLKNFE